MLRTDTNLSRETMVNPTILTAYLKNTRVKITGIDLADCSGTLESKLAEFRKLVDINIVMYTPRLAEYYRQREEV